MFRKRKAKHKTAEFYERSEQVGKQYRSPSYYLHKFWKDYSAAEDSLSRLLLLRKAAEWVSWTRPKKAYSRRKGFDLDKHERFDLQGQSCLICGRLASVRHHIIQIQNGGRNTDSNVAPLCRPCHADVHPWLREPRGIRL